MGRPSDRVTIAMITMRAAHVARRENRLKRRQLAMPQNAFSIEPFEAKRVRVESARSFDEVLLNLRNLVGTALPQTGTRRRDSLAHSFLSLLHMAHLQFK
jgi:hypothetical protein